MTVHFIGAGPGAADLITVRGRDLMARCPVCLYVGSLIPRELLAHCPPDARIVNTASMDLDQIIAEIAAAHAAGIGIHMGHCQHGDQHHRPQVFHVSCHFLSKSKERGKRKRNGQHLMPTCKATMPPVML